MSFGKIFGSGFLRNPILGALGLSFLKNKSELNSVLSGRLNGLLTRNYKYNKTGKKVPVSSKKKGRRRPKPVPVPRTRRPTRKPHHMVKPENVGGYLHQKAVIGRNHRLSKSDALALTRVDTLWQRTTELEADAGAIPLYLTQTDAGQYPFHVIDLTSLADNTATSTACILYLQENGAWNDMSTEGAGEKICYMDSPMTTPIKKGRALLSSVKLKFLFRGLHDRPVKYSLFLFNVGKDTDLDPRTLIGNTDANDLANSRSTYGNMLHSYIVNPASHIPTNIRGRKRLHIKWRKTFDIAETPSDLDYAPRVNFDLCWFANKYLKYNFAGAGNVETPIPINAENTADVNTDIDAAGIQVWPQCEQRWYLGIMASEYLDSAEIGEGDSPSYDVSMKKIFYVPSANLNA